MEEIFALVERAQTGDAEAYGILVSRFQDMAYGYAYAILGDFELAQDVAQEAFIDAYQGLPNLREPLAFPAWLKQIVHSRCQRLTRRKQHHTVPLDVVAETASPLPGPAEVAEQQELAYRVQDAIRELPVQQRVVTTLFYINGYSHQEIADFIEAPVTTVKSRLHASRGRLRERMIDMVEDELKANKLGEEFAIGAVRAAVEEAKKAFWERRNRSEAAAKIDEALALIEPIAGASEDALRAEAETLDARADFYLLVDRTSLVQRYEALRAAEKLGDPKLLARQLTLAAGLEIARGDRDRGQAMVDRARSIYEQLADLPGVAYCYELSGSRALRDSDFKTAHDLFARGVEIERSVPGEEHDLLVARSLNNEPVVRAIEAAGLDTTWDELLFFSGGSGAYHVEDEMSVFGESDAWWGGSSEEHGRWHRKMIPFMAGRSTRLLPLIPKVGDEWTYPVRADCLRNYEESGVVESISDAVITPADEFVDCVRTIRRTTGPDPDDNCNSTLILGKRTTWFAPGVGIVRSIYKPVSGEVVTSELTGYNVSSKGRDYVPMADGNWWRYRWTEGEEEHGYRTESYVEIVRWLEQWSQFQALCYAICVASS